MKKFIHDLTDNEKRTLIGLAIGVVTIAIIAIMFLGGNKPKEIVSNEKKDPFVQSSSAAESSSDKEGSKAANNSSSSGSKNVWMALDPSKAPEKKPEEQNVKVTATDKSEHVVTPKDKSEEVSESKPEESSSIQVSEKAAENETDPKEDSKENANSESTQISENKPENHEHQNEDNSEDKGWVIGNAVADESPYTKQKLGATTAQQFAHPNEKLALDFSNNINLAKNAYVLPTGNGFVVFNRVLINLLNISDSDLLEAEDNALDGAVIVRKISKEEKEGLKKEENVLYSFIEDGDVYVMIKGFPIKEDVQKVLTLFGIPAVNASNISSAVVANGELSAPSKLPANNDLEWLGISSSLNSDPAKIEMAYNLPLYAASDRYKPNGTDIRKMVPTSGISYYTGSCDINGDGINEYLVHCIATGDAGSGIQGYWAVFAPSKQGLVLAALSKYGNGGFVSSENQLYFVSEAPEENGVTVSLQSMNLPMKSDGSDVVSLKFRLLEDFPSKWTGKQIAEDYPGYMIVRKNDKYFAVDKEEFDTFIELAKEKLQSAKTNELLKDDKMVNEKITDVAEYLDTILSVPFGKEWEKAISADKLGGITENLTEENIRGNN